MKSFVCTLIAVCVMSSVSFAQDKAGMKMSKEAMMAQKMMMEPAAMKDAEMAMMGEMMHESMGRQMVHGGVKMMKGGSKK